MRVQDPYGATTQVPLTPVKDGTAEARSRAMRDEPPRWLAVGAEDQDPGFTVEELIEVEREAALGNVSPVYDPDLDDEAMLRFAESIRQSAKRAYARFKSGELDITQAEASREFEYAKHRYRALVARHARFEDGVLVTDDHGNPRPRRRTQSAFAYDQVEHLAHDDRRLVALREYAGRRHRHDIYEARASLDDGDRYGEWEADELIAPVGELHFGSDEEQRDPYSGSRWFELARAEEDRRAAEEIERIGLVRACQAHIGMFLWDQPDVELGPHERRLLDALDVSYRFVEPSVPPPARIEDLPEQILECPYTGELEHVPAHELHRHRDEGVATLAAGRLPERQLRPPQPNRARAVIAHLDWAEWALRHGGRFHDPHQFERAKWFEPHNGRPAEAPLGAAAKERLQRARDARAREAIRLRSLKPTLSAEQIAVRFPWRGDPLAERRAELARSLS